MTAIALLCGVFLCVASGAGSVTANLAFTGAVVLVFAWIAAPGGRPLRIALPPPRNPSAEPVNHTF